MTSRRSFLASAAAAGACASEAQESAPAAEGAAAPTVFELRNYQTTPGGGREALIEMFERSFLDAYEAGGTRVVGPFRLIDDRDRWVWIRAFADAASRGGALRNFYTSAAWRAEAGPANATIVDTSNVLLLRPVSGSVFAETPSPPRQLKHGTRTGS